MKKFVLVDHWGRWEVANSKTVIYGTVCGYSKMAESNDYYSLRESLHTEYCNDGTWHFTRVVKRAEAKKMGLA
jgi:hypothetical protein